MRHKASRGNKAGPATGPKKGGTTTKAAATMAAPAGKTKAQTGTGVSAAAGGGGGTTSEKKNKSCARCGKAANKACGGCKLAWYCSRECQSDHWQKSHKAACTKVHLNRGAH
jgi:hypothetical protein